MPEMTAGMYTLMNGFLTKSISSTSSAFQLTLKPMVAKYNVKIKAPGSGCASFTATSAKICRVPVQIYKGAEGSPCDIDYTDDDTANSADIDKLNSHSDYMTLLVPDFRWTSDATLARDAWKYPEKPGQWSYYDDWDETENSYEDAGYVYDYNIPYLELKGTLTYGGYPYTGVTVRHYIGTLRGTDQASTLEAIRGKQYNITLSFDGITAANMASVNYTALTETESGPRWSLDIPVPDAVPLANAIDPDYTFFISAYGGTATIISPYKLNAVNLKHTDDSDYDALESVLYSRIGCSSFGNVSDFEEAKQYARQRRYCTTCPTPSGTSNSVTVTWNGSQTGWYGKKGMFDVYEIGDPLFNQRIMAVPVECGAEATLSDLMNEYSITDEWGNTYGVTYLGEKEENWANWSSNGSIDLDLPSGTRWGYANLMADCCWESSDFYTWGETYASWDFTQSGYASPSWIYVGSPLPLTNDAAYQANGGGWRIPTESDWDELFAYTDRETVTINGVNCVKFMSCQDANDYIIIPQTGWYKDGAYDETTFSYWTSEYVDPWDNDYKTGEAYSYRIVFEVSKAIKRWYGLPIRGVER